MGRRNPIRVVGEPMRKGVTWLSDELIRAGAHNNTLGSDGFVVMAFLLSWAPTASRIWETSAAHLSEQFGWGGNRVRAGKALAAAVKDNRLVIREYMRDGKPVQRRCMYVVAAGGRRFTDEEISRLSAPIVLPSKANGEDSE